MVCILIVGNPMSGFSYYGPFANRAVAHTWASERFDNDWWIAPLQPTEDGE